MGLNTNLAYVFGADVDDLRQIGLVPTGGSFTGEAALVMDGTASVLVRGADLLLADGTFEHATDAVALAGKLGRRVVVVLIGSTGDTFSLEVAEPGSDSPVRHLVHSYGERVVDVGDPLPEEEGVEALTEDSAQELFEALTGVAPLSDEVFFAHFQELGAPPEKGSRGGFWSRLTGRG